MAIARGQQRSAGQTVASSEAKEASAESELRAGEGKDGDIQPERKFRTPGFSRMRMTWASQDQPMMDSAKYAVDDRIVANFGDAYVILNDIFDTVRTPEYDAQGEVRRDRHGMPIWARKSNGDFDEDWSRLTRQERENLMFKITTRIADWEQRAADAWGEAMLDKGQWEEKFAIEFDAPYTGTVDDRTAAGRIGSAEERYFAIFVSWYSRRADAIVKSMNLISQRLKDAMLL